ncbi:hypothetical protein QQ045_017754 [Rhodiola kirilowii]
MKMEGGVGGGAGSQIDRTSSIENEPKTLHMNQMEYAREAALYVLSTSSVEDAMRIFTEGLKPVRESLLRWQGGSEDYGFDHGFRNVHVRRASSAGRFKEIATAPF